MAIDFSGMPSRGPMRRMAKKDERKKRGTDVPVMGSMKNVDAGTGRGATTFKQDKKPAMRAQKPAGERKPAGEPVAPPSIESQQTAGIAGLAGSPSGPSVDNEPAEGKTTSFEANEIVNQETPRMLKGLFGEDIPEEKYREMERKNRDSGFYGQFKKGGQVKKTKKYASGGSVSSASSRGDGCAQRGKTKGRMV
jgi:hypothetical protein